MLKKAKRYLGKALFALLKRFHLFFCYKICDVLKFLSLSETVRAY